MITAQDRVYKCMQELNSAVTTAEVAEKLSLSRSVVSHYLNDLAKANKIIKVNGRPVKWQVTSLIQSVTKSVFDNFIGYRGSMKKILEQIKAAVVYPPDGLNILITGHSGVGKSYLASKIAEYARENKTIAADAPYIVLNCADYANNPELVSSMLFGYVKGAYTGADENREGLLQQADGGYLFLDEVHRLSSESQEKLFSFIDSGKFYRMGDNVHAQTAKVRLILATTEKPEEALLTTFLRRIPVRVNLPDFIKRPVDERLTLLRFLFYQEAKLINKKIRVNKYVVSSLLQLNHQGNIGYLKNIIRVSCAAAYQKQQEQEIINLELEDVLLDSSLAFEDFGKLEVDPDQPFRATSISISEQRIADLKNELRLLAASYDAEKVATCKLQLQRFSELIPEWALKSGLHLNHQRLFKQIIEERFGLQHAAYLEKVMYLFYERHFVLEEKLVEKLETELTNQMPRSLHVARLFYQKLAINLPGLAQSLSILLALLISDHIDENIQLRGLIVAHGENTATSIQAVVNSLCETYIFDAIDMPIDSGVNSIIEEANHLIDTYNTTNGFILMFDMGSLTQLYSAIKSHLDGDVLVINNLTTLTALDVALKIKQNTPFKKIANDADENYGISVQYYKGFSQSNNILVSCISGMGIAETVSQIIGQFLPNDIKVIPVDYSSLKEKINSQDWDYFDQTMFVLTTIDLPDSVKVKHMNLYSLLDDSGEKNLYRWLASYMPKEEITEFIQQLIRFFSKEGISERLSFLNPDVILKQVESINSKYESYYHLRLSGKVKLNLYMHIALMIERLMIQKPADVPVTIEDSKEADFFKITKSIFQPIEIKYNVKISDYEISLLYELFRQFI